MEVAGPLAGVRVLDLSRILAGPTCTQLLGDLGADVIKVERPGAGDDTRAWGPPYVKDADGRDTTESAYYLSANRNKRSVTIDISQPDGAALVSRLAGRSDILIENFKTGALDRYGLGYQDLKEPCPGLVYCSITGFGRTGPYADRAGYDFLIQAMGGIMSITGDVDGEPVKVGVGIADVMCGMYAASAILAALRHRDLTGLGQHIDLALMDSQVAWLINAGLYYLTSGETPPRLGNGHPNIVPYEVFPTADGHMALAVGNDAQFRKFCEFAQCREYAGDARFSTNDARVRHRDELIPLLRKVTVLKTTEEWTEGLRRLGVPCGPVNDIRQVFADPQVNHRNMKVSVPHAMAGEHNVDVIGNPINLSSTPVTYRRGPPVLGEHTEEVLQEVLDMNDDDIAALKSASTI